MKVETFETSVLMPQDNLLRYERFQFHVEGSEDIPPTFQF